MRKAAIGCLGVALAPVIVILIWSIDVQLGRIQTRCQGKTSRIETVHDAIEVVRTYNGEWPFDGNLNGLRQSKEFQSDEYGPTGGWRVTEWHEFLTGHGFDVDFEMREPDVALECYVLPCGAVDHCRTLGAVIFKD